MNFIGFLLEKELQISLNPHAVSDREIFTPQQVSDREIFTPQLVSDREIFTPQPS